MTDVESIADYLDGFLRHSEIDDYSGAHNGLQITNERKITKVAAAVDLSIRTIEECIESRANLLLVHHGMFWNGAASFVGSSYRRIKLLLENGIAVYSSHLPLDMHPEVGNNVLLARELGLKPTNGFAHSKGVAVGVAGECDIPTPDLVQRASLFSQNYGGSLVTTRINPEQRTKRWGLCTGSGASAETLEEAKKSSIDTLIVGEGPHWTAVAAEDYGITLLYAGHYATETLGVQALAEKLSGKFGMPWTFLHAPTGL